MFEIAFIFPGQGAQYVGMGRDLYDNFKVVREIFEEANKVLDFDITQLCFEGPLEQLTRTENCQPAILTVSIAALRAVEVSFASFTPKFVAGLSLGEYSALVSAGSLEFEDALRIVKKRGQFMEEVSREYPGKMASIIGLSQDEVGIICKQSGAEIANLNCPGQIVVSGSINSIKEIIDLAEAKGAKKVITLDVSGPFHSSFMNSASSRLKSELEKVKILPPRIPVISNVTANHEVSPEEIRKNLTLQITTTTRWEDSIKLIIKEGVKGFFEIGPGRVLKGLLRRIDPGLEVYNVETAQDIKRLPCS